MEELNLDEANVDEVGLDEVSGEQMAEFDDAVELVKQEENHQVNALAPVSESEDDILPIHVHVSVEIEDETPEEHAEWINKQRLSAQRQPSQGATPNEAESDEAELDMMDAE